MEVTVGGIVTAVKRKATKNNTMMAFVTLEDLYGSMELLVFPKIYSEYTGLLTEDSVIVVKGRLSLREDDTPKILPDSIFSIEDTATELHEFNCPPELFTRAKAFISYFAGKKKVILRNAETGEVMYTGYIKDDAKILGEFKAILHC